jgi:hypothetical protein
MRRASCSVAALGLLLALAPNDARAASGVPTFSSIPEAHVPDMLHPRDAPSGVAAGEMLEGLTVQPHSFGGGHTSLTVTGVEGRCVTLGAPPPGLAPSGELSAGIRVSSGAMPMRVERFVADPKGQTNLEIVDAWIDTQTTAIRAAKTTRIALTPLAVGSMGYSVYGFRDAGILHVVLPSSPDRIAYVDGRGRMGFASCGHVRLTLDTSSTGAMILGAGLVRLPNKHRKAAAMNQADLADSTIERAEDSAEAVEPEQMRGFQIGVSTSRTKRDREPQISVTIGFAEEPLGITPSVANVPINGPMPMPQVID